MFCRFEGELSGPGGAFVSLALGDHPTRSIDSSSQKQHCPCPTYHSGLWTAFILGVILNTFLPAMAVVPCAPSRSLYPGLITRKWTLSIVKEPQMPEGGRGSKEGPECLLGLTRTVMVLGWAGGILCRQYVKQDHKIKVPMSLAVWWSQFHYCAATLYMHMNHTVYAHETHRSFFF